MNKSLLVGVLVAVGASGQFFAQTASAPPPYKFTTIDYPGAEVTVVNRINNIGELVGDFRFLGEGTTFPRHGFLFTAGAFTPIDFPGATSTSASDLDNAAAIVGWAAPGPSGYLFDRTTGVFNTLPAPITQVLGTNDAGDMVGVAEPIDGAVRTAFVRTGAGLVRFNVPGAAYTAAADINDRGVVVGWSHLSSPSDPRRGFIRRPDGSLLMLDVPGAVQTSPIGINNKEQIVGWYANAVGTHGFVHDGGYVQTVDAPAAAHTSVFGINDDGDLAGEFRIAFDTHGFVATPLADVVADEVSGLGDAAFGAGASGLRSAILNRLDHIERLIARGNTAAALRELQSLRMRVDGCPDPAEAGEGPGVEDWIEDCDAQRLVRKAIDELIGTLTNQ
jgi:hypothetical protein